MKFPVSIQLDRSSTTPLHNQISQEIITSIKEGAIKPETKLPSIRALSETLSVNTVTVVTAYKSLASEGYVIVKKGNGTFVRDIRQKMLVNDNFEGTDELFGIDDVELLRKGRIVMDSTLINMASTTPSLELVNFNIIREAIIDTVDIDGKAAFCYQESMGYRALRVQIAMRLKAEGIHTHENEIQIVSGAQQGLDIISKALLASKSTVVVETPTYTGALAVFQSRGAQVEAVKLDQDGMNMEMLANVMRRYKPDLIYTIPSYQNPTGYVYSIEKKLELIKLAKNFGCYIIEDDCLRELTYKGTPPVSLKSLDDSGRVILVKSYSKLFVPGLRIAFMAVPAKLANEISYIKHNTDIFTSGLIQRTFFRYLANGYWDKHLEQIIPIYKNRYNFMNQKIKEILPDDIEYHSPNGGLSFWLKFPPYIDMNSLYYKTHTKGLQYVPGSVFSTRRNPVNNYIRLSFAQTDEDSIEKGLNILAYCIQDIKATKPNKGSQWEMATGAGTSADFIQTV